MLYGLKLGALLLLYWDQEGKNRLLPSVIKEFKRAKKKVVEEKLDGWLCESDKSHHKMHEIILKLGGRYWFSDSKSHWFRSYNNV